MRSLPNAGIPRPPKIKKLKKLLIILLLLSGITGFGQTDEQKLVATLKEFHQALVKANTVSINQQTDKALSYGHSNGWLETKTEMIRNLETGYMKYFTYAEDSIQVFMNGNMASARFIADITGNLNGKDGSYHLKVLEVWVRKGNRWLLFARQAVKG